MLQINLQEWEDIGNLAEFRETPFIPLFEILTQSKDYVEIKDTSKNGIRIKAKNYVGFIPLDENYLIVVSPKVKVEDFLYLLFRSQGKKPKIRDFERIVKSGRNSGIEYANIFDFLIYVFLQELEKIKTVGVLKKSMPKVESRKSIKGKVLVKDTILRNQVFGKNNEVWCHYYELSSNIIENSAIKFTLWMFLSLYKIPTPMVTDFFEKYHYFDKITLPTTIDFLEEIEDIINNNKIPNSRQYYVDILNLCVFFISNSKLEYKSGKEVKLRAFVIDMNKVFEDFIRSVLVDRLSDDILVKDVKNQSMPLFENKNPNNFFVKPDYLFVVDQNFVCLADAKYKEKPSSSDFYQLLAYLDVYNLKRGILIYPLFDNQPQTEVFFRGDKEVWIYRMNLEHIVESETQLASFIGGLCKK